jgi:hypothetical protein
MAYRGWLFLVGEYVEDEIRDNPVFTVSPMASYSFTKLRSKVPLCGSHRS